MKHIKSNSIALLVLSMFFISSCSIEKRKYLSGYNIQWNKNKKEIDSQIKVSDIKDDFLTASTNNTIFIKNITDECDIIIMGNGTEIKAKVLELTSTEIKYKKCEFPNSPIYTVQKAEVFMVKYPDGNKDVITALPTKSKANVEIDKEPKTITQAEVIKQYNENQNTYKKPPEDKETGLLLKVLGWMGLIIGFVILVFASIIVGIILMGLGIVFIAIG